MKNKLTISIFLTVALLSGFCFAEGKSLLHTPPTFTGVADGAIEEITGVAQLVKLGVAVVTDKEKAQALWNSVKNINLESIKDAAVDFYNNKIDAYTSDKPYIVGYTAGKDAVQVATLLSGTAIFTKGAKEGLDKGIKETGERFARKSFKNAQELVESIVNNRNAIRKVLDSDAGKTYAKKYFDKFETGNFEDWYTNTFKKYDLGEPLNFEVHHVIPVKVLEGNKELQELLFWAKKEGKYFDFNSIDNGIPLQKKSIKYDVSGHANHPNYDREINQKIDEVLQNDSYSDTRKFSEIQKIISNTKTKLETEVLLGSKDVNQIINL